MERKKNKFLITGATGFVGSNLAKRLIEEDYEVHILTRKTSDLWRLKDFYDKVNTWRVDLTEKEKLEKIVKEIQPNIIFHLATHGVSSEVQTTDDELIKINFIGSKNLIDVCNSIDYDCFVNTGSSSEYGIKNKPMKEDDVCIPINMYGITKNMATKYGQFTAKTKNKPIVSLRLFSPYGPFDHKDKLIPTVIQKVLKNQEINLADPDIGRDFIFIEEVIDLYFQSIEKANRVKGEIFNVGSGIQSSILDVVNHIINSTGSQSKINWGWYEKRNYDNEIWIADMNKTQKSFNWKPKYNLKQGLEKTIEWFRDNLNKYK